MTRREKNILQSNLPVQRDILTSSQMLFREVSKAERRWGRWSTQLSMGMWNAGSSTNRRNAAFFQFLTKYNLASCKECLNLRSIDEGPEWLLNISKKSLRAHEKGYLLCHPSTDCFGTASIVGSGLSFLEPRENERPTLRKSNFQTELALPKPFQKRIFRGF